MSSPEQLLELMLDVSRALRDRIFALCRDADASGRLGELSRVVYDGPGDTLFAIDEAAEAVLFERLEANAAALGGVVLVAEGLLTGERTFPAGTPPEGAAWRLICDPIDGTRCLSYQKRSAWVLCAAAPNLGPGTRFSDLLVAVQVEIPLLKQHLSDELWVLRGGPVEARRFDHASGVAAPVRLTPSAAPTIAQGYAMLTRLFPGARDELASIDDELMRRVLGPFSDGKAACFEEQYPSSGGQLYELLAGHDRFNADLRPLMAPLLTQRGYPKVICAHPYDVCTALIASSLGVILTHPDGSPLDPPLDVHTDVAWVGYANAAIRRQMEAPLQAILRERGLL